MVAVRFPLTSFRNPLMDLAVKVPARGLRRARPWLDRASARVNADLPVVEAVLGRVDATLSLKRVLARVVEVKDETHDVKTFVLRPNARFGTFRPGAYVTVRVAIDGRSVQRSYSLSSPPAADGTITLTIKRVPGGQVSNFLCDTLTAGHVLELSVPAGQFLLPAEPAEELLMISAGSGITPVMSMLRHLVKTGAKTRVTFLHFARTPSDVIFGEELARVAETASNVKVVVCVEQGAPGWTGPTGRFTEELLADVAPGFRELPTLLCGPAPFMKVVMQTLARTGADLGKLRYEQFGTQIDTSEFLDHAQVVRFLKSGVEAISSRPLTVLQEAEARGVKVETGCRAGTCGTCRCKKRKGVIVNTATGEVSGDGEEMIYACVSVARGAVEVEL